MAKEMNLLAIETSTSHASVALSVQGRLFVLEEASIRQHARVLLLMIDKLLLSAGVDFQAIDGIVFGEGPGSFTGVRIACSVAKGLAYAHDLPLFPVGGLQAIAYAARQFERPVLVMLDARMNQVYWAFQPEQGGVAQVSSPEDVSLPADTQKITVAGVAFQPYLDALPASVYQIIEAEHEIFPRADMMIDMVQSGKIQAVTAEQAMPVYVREQVIRGACG
jgi:tRNA threonylcarbamoyladenosine biosynthesis protein TsaB